MRGYRRYRHFGTINFFAFVPFSPANFLWMFWHWDTLALRYFGSLQNIWHGDVSAWWFPHRMTTVPKYLCAATAKTMGLKCKYSKTSMVPKCLPNYLGKSRLLGSLEYDALRPGLWNVWELRIYCVLKETLSAIIECTYALTIYLVKANNFYSMNMSSHFCDKIHKCIFF